MRGHIRVFGRRFLTIRIVSTILVCVFPFAYAPAQTCAAANNQVIVTPGSGALSVTLNPTGVSPAVNLSFTATTNMNSGGNKLYMWAYFPNSTALSGQTYGSEIIPTSAVYAQHNGTYQLFSAGGPDPWGDTNAVQIAQVNGVGKGCQTFTATLSIAIDLTKLATAPRAQTFTGTVYVRAQVR